MRKTVLRRLEALEKEHRSREQKHQSALEEACMYIWRIVLAYYLGGLESDGEVDISDALARALNYRSGHDLFKATDTEICERLNDAYRRLFAKVGLDFDDTPPNVLFDAFVRMVNQLPDQYLEGLRSNLRQWCSGAEIAAGSNLPRRLSADNFFIF
jgi:hypothetical protein